MDRFDRYWIGILAGLVIPAAFALLYLHVMGFALGDFHGRLLSKLLMVSVFPDLALIFLFYSTDTWRLSKGVLIGAMPYLLASLMVVM